MPRFFSGVFPIFRKFEPKDSGSLFRELARLLQKEW